MSPFTSASPRPRPPSVLASDCFAWTKGRKISSPSPGSTPAPVSRTETSTSSPATATESVTCPPAGVNFAAFWRRFPITCASRVSSPWTQIGPSGVCVAKRMPRSCMTAR